MRLITTILLLVFFKANANVYYVSNSGSNAANGLTTGTAWQTLSKVNGFTFAANDSILLKCGDTWNEQLLPPRSNLYFGQYGTGVKPLITALQTLSGFTNTSGNIWSVTASNSVKNQNTVIINGAIRAKGRYPNTTYLSSNNAATTQTRLVGTGLTGTPNYTGSELVTKGYNWIIDINKISSQSVDTLNVLTSFTFAVTNYLFFIQNTPSVLDLQNEWCYDSASKLISVYSTSNPSVKISTIDTLIYLHSKSYIIFDGISFSGGNKQGVRMDTCEHIVIKNCTSNYNNIAISGTVANYITVQSDSILNSLTNAIQLFTPGSYANACNNLLIDNNYVLNTNTLVGMGNSGNGSGVSIYVAGLTNLITNNRVDSSGYCGIIFAGTNNLVKNNFINTFCFTKDDGGGIYTSVGSGPLTYDTGSIIRGNIVLNGIGVTGMIAVGIYLDDNTNGITVDSNTVSNCSTYGIFLHTNSKINVLDNVVMDSTGIPLAVSAGSPFNNTTIKRNILYQRNTLKYIVSYNSLILNNVDSNYYLRPLLESNNIYGVNGITAYTSLPTWSAISGFDTHSNLSPFGLASNYGSLYYNSTQSDIVVSVGGSFLDHKGTRIYNSFVLKPFTSKIIFAAVSNFGPKISTAFKIGSLNFQ